MEDLAQFEYLYSLPEPEDTNKDGSPSLFQNYVVAPDPQPYPSFGQFSDLVTVPASAASGAITKIYDSVSGTIKGTYLYLLGGIVIIGILAVVVLGAGTKFLGKLEGG